MNVQAQEQDVAVAGKTGRIRALDIIRGFFLLVILIDHIELYPSLFDLFTGRGRLFVSAAEGFFFMSGLLVGLVYKRRLAQGLGFITRKMWTRAAELYIGSVVLSLFFTWWAVASNHTGIKYGLPATINWPHIFKETLLMRYGFGWADFLDRFAILMLLAPIAFYLLSKGRWKLMLAISFAVWLLRGNNFTLSWQLLFNSAMLVGFYWQPIRDWLAALKPQTKIIVRRSVLGVTAVTFTLSWLIVFLLSLLNQHYGSLTPWLRHLTFSWNHYNADVWVYAQKWTMGPLRLVLFFFWFAALFYLVEKHQNAISRRTWGVVELVGRNSLFVYIAHSFVVFIFKLFIPSETNLAQNFAITLAALVALVLATILYRPVVSEWTENKSLNWRKLLHKSKAQLALHA